MKKLNAKRARKKYFEYYVNFENIIKNKCQKNNKVIKKLLLSDLIKIFVSLKNFSIYTIKATELQNQRMCRNWLAHTEKNIKVSDQNILEFKKIKKINKKLLKII